MKMTPSCTPRMSMRLLLPALLLAASSRLRHSFKAHPSRSRFLRIDWAQRRRESSGGHGSEMSVAAIPIVGYPGTRSKSLHWRCQPSRRYIHRSMGTATFRSHSLESCMLADYDSCKPPGTLSRRNGVQATTFESPDRHSDPDSPSEAVAVTGEVKTPGRCPRSQVQGDCWILSPHPVDSRRCPATLSRSLIGAPIEPSRCYSIRIRWTALW